MTAELSMAVTASIRIRPTDRCTAFGHCAMPTETPCFVAPGPRKCRARAGKAAGGPSFESSQGDLTGSWSAELPAAGTRRLPECSSWRPKKRSKAYGPAPISPAAGRSKRSNQRSNNPPRLTGEKIFEGIAHAVSTDITQHRSRYISMFVEDSCRAMLIKATAYAWHRRLATAHPTHKFFNHRQLPNGSRGREIGFNAALL